MGLEEGTTEGISEGEAEGVAVGLAVGVSTQEEFEPEPIKECPGMMHEQTEAPADEVLFAGQGMHDDEDVEKVPATQGEQIDCPTMA